MMMLMSRLSSQPNEKHIAPSIARTERNAARCQEVPRIDSQMKRLPRKRAREVRAEASIRTSLIESLLWQE
jgi:hypothetical protein